MSKTEKRKYEDASREEMSAESKKLRFESHDVENVEITSMTATSPDKNEWSMVNIPDAKSPSGFSKGYEAEKILGVTKMNNKILFLIKW